VPPRPIRKGDGATTLNDAYRQVQKKPKNDERKQRTGNQMLTLITHDGKKVPYRQPLSKPKFNRTNEQISWAAWSWNPVTGCLHGCKYCYAREWYMVEKRLGGVRGCGARAAVEALVRLPGPR
jgi:hypothetical protein